MATWDALLAAGARREYKVEFNDGNGFSKTFDEDTVSFGGIQYDLFEGGKLSLGGTVAKEAKIGIVDPLVDGAETIPRACPFWIFIRLNDGVETTNWYPLGRYFVDVRERSETIPDLLSITGYDALLKGENPYYPYGSTITGWPKTDIAVVNEIAGMLGVTLDQSVVLDRGYSIQSPDAGEGGFTINEVLGGIGAMYGGNWYLNNDDYLCLYTIGSEISLLIDESGDYISDSTGVMLIV